MRKKNFKGRCEKRVLGKCAEVCRTYDAIQYVYAGLLQASDEVVVIRCNVLLDGLEVGEYTSENFEQIVELGRERCQRAEVPETAPQLPQRPLPKDGKDATGRGGDQGAVRRRDISGAGDKDHGEDHAGGDCVAKPVPGSGLPLHLYGRHPFCQKVSYPIGTLPQPKKALCPPFFLGCWHLHL